ncbi:MAG: hypothetical protein JNM51_01270 [Bacteroidia bacterium]|nr:hypothetical protein [Bacteroidia bacterium]
MTVTQIEPDKFEIIKFPKETEFTFGVDNYKIEFTDPEEIRMALYIRSVKVFKNQKLIKSNETCDPSYFEITSKNKKFLALPTKNGIEITNLETGETAEFDSFFMIGNEFDNESKYCLINGQNDSKLIDLATLKVKFKYKNNENYISQARFGYDNKLWTIEEWGQKFRIEHLDTESLTSEYSVIEKPFDFFKISIEKYSKIMESKSHCVWLMTGGGMRFSSFLNRWEHVPCKEKIIYKTLIPQSEVAFNKNYNVDSCNGEFEFVEFKQTSGTKEQKENNTSSDSTMWTRITNLFK